MQRYFLDEPLAVGQTIELTGEIAHHMLKVMRMQVDQLVELVSVTEQAFVAVITALDGPSKLVQLQIQSVITTQVELPVATTIVCGLSKGDKTDWIVQKGTQLGAQRFIFCNSQFSIAKWDAKKQFKKIQRIQKIAQEAAEQAHRTHVPTVEWRADLKAVTQEAATVKLIAYEESAKTGETAQLVQSLSQLSAGQQLLCVFGPEGGLAPQEVAQLVAAGFVVAGLGPRFLSAETAPLYLLSALSYVTELATL